MMFPSAEHCCYTSPGFYHSTRSKGRFLAQVSRGTCPGTKRHAVAAAVATVALVVVPQKCWISRQVLLCMLGDAWAELGPWTESVHRAGASVRIAGPEAAESPSTNPGAVDGACPR